MINLDWIQKEHKEWQKKNFGVNRSSEMCILGLIEELGELSHAYTKDLEHVRTNEDHVDNMKNAVGDIFIFLMSFCSSEGIYIEDAIEETWDEVKQRDWIKYPEKGRPNESD